jgi:predicted permease
MGALRAAGALHIPATIRLTETLIAAMPVSLSVGAVASRQGADVGLATASILVTTLASIVTVPIIYAAAVALGG